MLTYQTSKKVVQQTTSLETVETMSCFLMFLIQQLVEGSTVIVRGATEVSKV